MEQYIGQIQAFGFNFAPQGWALCQGQLLSIAENDALFSLLGTTYGGDGVNTFGLPDLRGRSPIGYGQGPGLSSIQLGQNGGSETVMLTVNNLPAHRHMATATSSDANGDEASNGALLGTAGANIYASGGSASVTLAADSTTSAGGNQAFSNQDPYLCINYCIALVGIYPSRN